MQNQINAKFQRSLIKGRRKRRIDNRLDPMATTDFTEALEIAVGTTTALSGAVYLVQWLSGTGKFFDPGGGHGEPGEAPPSAPGEDEERRP